MKKRKGLVVKFHCPRCKEYVQPKETIYTMEGKYRYLMECPLCHADFIQYAPPKGKIEFVRTNRIKVVME